MAKGVANALPGSISHDRQQLVFIFKIRNPLQMRPDRCGSELLQQFCIHVGSVKVTHFLFVGSRGLRFHLGGVFHQLPQNLFGIIGQTGKRTIVRAVAGNHRAFKPTSVHVEIKIFADWS